MKTLNYLFVLDRSGSMLSLRQQTLENVNGQISQIKNDAKATGVKINLSILLFDSRGHNHSDWFSYLVRNKDISDVNPITPDQYYPSGGTPLYDAIGVAVEGVQKDLGNTLGDTDQKILVTAFTDGEENESKKYTQSSVQKMIKQLQEDGKFLFTFIGCGGIDEVRAVSMSLGISVSNAMAYTADAAGNNQAFEGLKIARTAYLSDYSRGIEKDVDFFAEKS